MESEVSSVENRVRLGKGRWRSAADVESVGEVASEGARYLRLMTVVEGGEGRSWGVIFCLRHSVSEK
jgi:hypothetical protein